MNIDTKPVLFCTDFSSNAREAFSYAVRTAVHHGLQEVHLLHVIPAPDAQFWKPYIYEVNADVDQMAKEAFDKKVIDEYATMLPDGLKIKACFRIGKAHTEITKYADEIDAGLIVIGRQGRGALESLLFGTVAEKVVKKANCPVLVIPMTNQGSK